MEKVKEMEKKNGIDASMHIIMIIVDWGAERRNQYWYGNFLREMGGRSITV